MKTTPRILSFLAILAVMTGCSSPQGGVTGTNDSFSISVPPLPVALKAGDKQTITVTLNRGTEFKQDVVLSPEVPKGLKVEMPNSTLVSGKHTVKVGDPKEVAFSILADKDAKGDYNIKLNATPEKGTPTFKDIKVIVSQ